jgi:hypothetical protein
VTSPNTVFNEKRAICNVVPIVPVEMSTDEVNRTSASLHFVGHYAYFIFQILNIDVNAQALLAEDNGLMYLPIPISVASHLSPHSLINGARRRNTPVNHRRG